MLCFLQTVGSEVERGKAGSVSARTVLSPKSSIWLVSPASLMGREWSLQNERGGMKGKSLLVAARGQGRVWWGINSPFTATPHTTSSLIPKLSFFFFFFYLKYSWFIGFPGSSAGKESACNAGDLGSIPGLRRSPGWEDPLEKGMVSHYSILAQRIPMDRGAWWATVHGDQRVGHDWVTKHSTAHSWFTVFQVYSEVTKVYIYNNLYVYSFQILFHYRL